MEIIKNRLRHYGEALTDTDMIEESLVVIVPDTNPDALQIIGSKASLYVQEKSCAQGLLKITGSASCQISYLSTDGKEPYIVTAAIPFSLSKEIAGMAADDKMLTDLRLLNVSAAMVNPRKLSLRVQVQVFEQVYKCQVVEYAENVTAASDEGVNCRSENKSFKTVTDIVEKRVVFNDEIRLSGQQPNGNSVMLRNEADWVSEDVKILPNKIMIRGRIDTIVTTMDENGCFSGKNKYAVPFSQIVECDGVNADDEVEIVYSPAREDVEIFTSSDGVTTMSFAFAAVTCCIVKRKVVLTTVNDIYSTKWNIQSKKACATTCLPPEPKCMKTQVKETIALEGGADRILDISVIGEVSSIGKNESTVGANFYIMVIYQETDGTVLTSSKKVYAESMCKEPFRTNGACVPSCSEPSAIISGDGEATVTFEGILMCMENNQGPIEMISDCSIDKTVAKTTNIKASLIIKTVEKNETVWEIAKAYNTTPSVIASANKLSANDEIAAGRLILIPFVNR